MESALPRACDGNFAVDPGRKADGGSFLPHFLNQLNTKTLARIAFAKRVLCDPAQTVKLSNAERYVLSLTADAYRSELASKLLHKIVVTIGRRSRHCCRQSQSMESWSKF